MKKTIISAALLFTVATLLVSSCKKDDAKPQAYVCTTCTTTPDALAVNDASGKGVYKGVLIGSTGTIKFSVQNGTNDITATMVIDNTTVVLTSAVNWVDGQPYVAPFTGTMNGQPVSITFSVQPNGGSPIITSTNIPGHPNADFTLVKETSNALIECFEGTYSTTAPETGTFNILLSRTLGKWGGIAREDNSTDEDDINGDIVNGVLKDDNGNTVGTLSGDEINGSFQDGNGSTVTVTGERTL
ncbi:MAG: hypothetical protein EOP49_44725 [Sphingobacteriales bacterium]|nr:MAG: hypothetical protein EOP49_44725 [Sphingobacteriales bacterium]